MLVVIHIIVDHGGSLAVSNLVSK